MKHLVTFFFVASQIATASETSAHWRDLSAMLTGKDIILDMSGGDHIRGVVLAVEGDSMILRTRKRARQPVPRTNVRDVRIARRNSCKWRIISTAIGAGAGAAIATPVLAETHNEGSSNYDGAAVGAVAGLAVIGFVLGWQTDHARDLVRILPD